LTVLLATVTSTGAGFADYVTIATRTAAAADDSDDDAAGGGGVDAGEDSVESPVASEHATENGRVTDTTIIRRLTQSHRLHQRK